MQRTIEVIDNMTRTIQRATKEVKKLQERLNQLQRRNTKVPRKLKKQLKKKYSRDEYLLKKRFGCFSKQYSKFRRSSGYSLLFFGGGRRNYLLQKYINREVLNHYFQNSGIMDRIAAPEEGWNFIDFPDNLKNYISAMTNHQPVEPKVRRIENFLHPEIFNRNFPLVNWEKPAFIDFFEKEHSKVQGLSVNHLLMEDFKNIENYEQTEQNNSSSTFGPRNPGEDTEATDR